MLMPLSFRERLTMLIPPSVFYRQRIAQEARTGEPELAVLADLVPRGGIAVDVGANIGFFAYALLARLLRARRERPCCRRAAERG
jgi:hypothetical protein